MSESVPFIDLAAQFAALRDDIQRAVARVFESQQFILGSEVEAFERELAEYLGLDPECVIGVSSGTDALTVALLALGVEPGDRVLTTPFSFFATAGSIARLGAVPEFVDIDPVTLNLDTRRLAHLDPKRYAAVVCVHLFGRTADVAGIRSWAEPAGTPLVEDAAQALGARDAQGRPCGTLGDVAAFSFFPTKNLGAAGDAGCVTARDPEVASRCRLLRVHGARRPYENELLGGNFRLDELQAAVLRVKLRHLDTWNRARIGNALYYREALEDLTETGLELPPVPGDGTFNAHQFVIRHFRRDALRAWLTERRIASAVYYPRPLHLVPALLSPVFGEGSLPVAERAAREVLALPVFAELGEARRERVAAAVREFVERAS